MFVRTRDIARFFVLVISEWISDVSCQQLFSYDYIVVGGGSSGAILASKLGKKGHTLLIERGANISSFPHARSRGGWPFIVNLGLDLNFSYDSGMTIGVPKILGGGAALNGGVCWRAELLVFESMGIPKDAVTRAFNFLENQGNELCGVVDSDTEIVNATIDVWQQMGYSAVPESGLGSWAHRAFSIQRARSLFSPSSRRKWITDRLYPEETKTTSLTILLHTRVDKIIFADRDSENGPLAIGVLINSPAFGEVEVLVRRGGEVFLSGGAIETPKLLMLSGVGPRDVLEGHGVGVVANLPEVGRNAIDRKEVTLGFPMFRDIHGDTSAILDVALIAPDVWMSVFKKTALPWGNAFQLPFCKPKDRTEKCRDQLLELASFDPQLIPQQFWNNFLMYVGQRRPHTRGHVTLASVNPEDDAIFFDGWDLDNPTPELQYDIDVFVNATLNLVVPMVQKTDLLEKLGHGTRNISGPFTKLSYEALSRVQHAFQTAVSGCHVSKTFRNSCTASKKCVPTIPPLPLDLQQLRQSIQEIVTSSYHVQGTVAAGTSVHRGTFHVIGVRGLRVVDMSVVPVPVDTHPMMTAMALAYYVAEQVNVLPDPELEVMPIIVGVVLTIGAVVFTLAAGIQSCMSCKKVAVQATSEDGAVALVNEGPAGMATLALRKPITDTIVCIDTGDIDIEYAPSVSQPTDIDIGDASKSSFPYTVCSKATLKSKNTWLGGSLSDGSAGSEGDDSYALVYSSIGCSYKQNGQQQNVLTECGLAVRSRELVAIMGASGCGKSTVMDIFAGRKQVGTLSGHVSAFGESGSVSEMAPKLRESCAYIDQDLTFMPMQTAEEAVAFYAALRLGRDVQGTRTRRIRDTLASVGLSLRAIRRPIGGKLAGGLSIRGFSGGEKKRLALACALATKPRLMFLDEITSGLDSENAFATIRLVKQLCESRKIAAITVIHQPGPNIFSLFDRLLLLAPGKLLFSGLVCSLPSFYSQWFEGEMPAADVFIENLMRSSLQTSIDSWLELPPEPHSTDKWQMDGSLHEQKMGLLWQLRVVFLRNLQCNYTRNPVTLFARLACYAALSLADGAIFWQVAKDMKDTSDAESVMRAFTFLIQVSYLLPFAMIPVFSHDKAFFMRESAMGLYTPVVYCIAQAFLELWVLTLAAVIEACILVPMCGLGSSRQSSLGSLWSFVGILVVSGNVGSAIVMTFAMILPQDLAFALGAGAASLFQALSGGFTSFSEMPNHVRWLEWVSPCKYTFQSLCMVNFEGTKFEFILDKAELRAPDTVAANMGILVSIFVLLSFVSTVSLSMQRERK